MRDGARKWKGPPRVGLYRVILRRYAWYLTVAGAFRKHSVNYPSPALQPFFWRHFDMLAMEHTSHIKLDAASRGTYAWRGRTLQRC